MQKTITITYENEQYTLGFNRKAVAMLEDMGITLATLNEKPTSYIPKFFNMAFYQFHTHISNKKLTDMWDTLENRNELISVLLECYIDTVNASIGDVELDENSKKTTWVLNK